MARRAKPGAKGHCSGEINYSRALAGLLCEICEDLMRFNGPPAVSMAKMRAKTSADARHQLPMSEWLGQVIVGADLQPHYPVNFFCPASDHHDRPIESCAS